VIDILLSNHHKRTLRLSDAEMEGIEVVLDTMKMHGMSESAKIVERYLVEDGIIVVSVGDGGDVDKDEDDEQNESRWMSTVADMIG
jgi:hypothetical protein